MSGQRSKIEIYIDIMTQIKNGVALPTRIMYGVNLSWKPFYSMLQSLLDQGLVECSLKDNPNKPKKVYRIIEKGESVLISFGKAVSLMRLKLYDLKFTNE